ncbi:MAG TPA: response regulator [Allosphingosinicella sp.]|jgi:DNA-binding response OmpR family regulator
MPQAFEFAREAGSRPARHPLGGPRKLLLVDDEPAVGRMMCHAAQECGYEAAVAMTATSFRRHYEEETPDIVLLDLSLPGGDGIELLRFLAEKKSQAVILIVSGFDRRVLEAARRLGEALGLRMGGCLTKPVFVNQLGEAIEKATRQFSAGGDDDAAHLCFRS